MYQRNNDNNFQAQNSHCHDYESQSQNIRWKNFSGENYRPSNRKKFHFNETSNNFSHIVNAKSGNYRARGEFSGNFRNSQQQSRLGILKTSI